MFDFYQTTKKMGMEVIEKITGYSREDFEVHQVSLKCSALYQEIEVIFFYKMNQGIFRSDKQLREFKYDLANNCGVMYQILNNTTSESKVIKTYGDVGILREKEWC